MIRIDTDSYNILGKKYGLPPPKCGKPENRTHTSHLSPYCCYVIYDPLYDDSNELCILSHTGVIVTADTFIVDCIDFQPTKTHL